MVYLARCEDSKHGFVQKKDISVAEGISADYVEQILIKLKTAGLIRSHRGKNGGFSLAKKATKISVADVLKATEGPINIATCLEEKCDRISVCVTRSLWQKANKALESVFSGTTIADLANDVGKIRESKSLSFTI